MRKTLSTIALIGLAASALAVTTNPPPFALGVPALTNAVAGTNVPVHILPVVQQAQDQLSQYLVLIIPLVVPLLIAGLKKFLPDVPSWALPILAPALGAVADLALQTSGVETGGMIKGALLGSAGVGLRELQNQVMQARNAIPAPPVAPPAVPPPAPAPVVPPVAKTPGEP